MTSPDAPTVPAFAQPEAGLVAATLCLMSCYAQHMHPAYAERIVGNLDALACSGCVSAELRTVCRRLADRWRTLDASSRCACSAGAVPDDRRVLQ